MQMGRTKATQSFWSIIRVVTVIMFVATRELPSVVGAAADSGKGGHELQGGGGAVGVGGVGTTKDHGVAGEVCMSFGSDSVDHRCYNSATTTYL